MIFQHYPPGTQKNYNNFSSRDLIMEKSKELEFSRRAGGGKGEPGVPPMTFDSVKLPFYSSLLFYTNHVSAFLKGKTEYAYSFYLLTFTSLLVHGIYDCTITNLIDKLAILQIVTIGGYYFMKNLNIMPVLYKISTVFSFIAVIIIYCYGYMTNQWCFDPNIEYAQFCHSSIHVLSSLGHHFIIGAI